MLPAVAAIGKSHPSWVCGLKRSVRYPVRSAQSVTPFVGVWIETYRLFADRLRLPRHTLRGCVDWNFADSVKFQKNIGHTLRGCVDWNQVCRHPRKGEECHTLRGCVDWNPGVNFTVSLKHSHTLRGCVDWNAHGFNPVDEVEQSHPSWVCGLKLIGCSLIAYDCQSHPSWVCGLKPIACAAFPPPRQSHPSWVCGLKPAIDGAIIRHICHTLRGCVDWNTLSPFHAETTSCHTLRGCVDWNFEDISGVNGALRHTLRGCVDWNTL